MFKISPVQSAELAKKYVEACGGSIKDECFVYAMTDAETGKIMGISQFEILGEEGYISDLRQADGPDDFEAMFILGRQTMNFIDSCGAHICKASKNSGDESLIRAIGFKFENDEYICNMTGLFDGKCGCH